MPISQTQFTPTPTQPSTAVVTSVPVSATSVQLLAANSARLGASIYNASSKTLFLKLGTTASLIDYTVQIGSKALYELPEPIYTGEIDGIWNGTDAPNPAKVTELT